MLQQANCDEVSAMLAKALQSNLAAAFGQQQQHRVGSDQASNKSGRWDSSSFNRSTDRTGSMNMGGHTGETLHERVRKNSSTPDLQKAEGGVRAGLLPDINHSPNSPHSPNQYSRLRRLSRTQDPGFSSFLERAGPFVFDRQDEGPDDDAEAVAEGDAGESPFTAAEKALTRLRSFSVKDRSPAEVAAATRGVHYSALALEEAVASQGEHVAPHWGGQ